jgi:GNAT superfamily N-acetyltransferase
MQPNVDQSPAADLQFSTVDAFSVTPKLDDLVTTYLRVYADNPNLFYNEDRFRQQLAGHLAVPGWTAALCELDSSTVAYSYGFPLQPETRWWEGLEGPQEEGFTQETGARTFAVSEIMVESQWRRRGLAGALHDLLLLGRNEERATLLVEPDNAPAQHAYASWGWTPVGTLRPDWEHAPLFDVLVLPLSSR